MSRLLRWLLLFSVAVNLAVVATAAVVHFFIGPMPFVRHFAERTLIISDRRLNLTQEQEKVFVQAEKDYEKKIDERIPVMRERRAKLINALADASTNQADLGRATQGVREVQEGFHQDWIDYVMRVKSALKPDQQKAFAEVLRERMLRPLRAPFALDHQELPVATAAGIEKEGKKTNGR